MVRFGSDELVVMPILSLTRSHTPECTHKDPGERLPIHPPTQPTVGPPSVATLQKPYEAFQMLIRLGAGPAAVLPVSGTKGVRSGLLRR
ncbi:Stabilin-1 [Manis pentadactyla]|nr:Stabilin-1 [Manis pentadactyla]